MVVVEAGGETYREEITKASQLQLAKQRAKRRDCEGVIITTRRLFEIAAHIETPL